MKTSELQEKPSVGFIFKPKSSALEKRSIASYQKAMSLINEYSSLVLESYGIALFDADRDREDLLKMITRAEGESWKNRLRPDGIPAETLRLEQSIRSLEDAESKNLRVLYNNNARLMILLTSELQQEPPDSERAIQINSRINELREKNQKIQTDIHDEVAKRANSYCRLAEKTGCGELSSAELISVWQRKPENRPSNMTRAIISAKSVFRPRHWIKSFRWKNDMPMLYPFEMKLPRNTESFVTNIMRMTISR
jgi:hypothetical protein